MYQQVYSWRGTPPISHWWIVTQPICWWGQWGPSWCYCHSRQTIKNGYLDIGLVMTGSYWKLSHLLCCCLCSIFFVDQKNWRDPGVTQNRQHQNTPFQELSIPTKSCFKHVGGNASNCDSFAIRVMSSYHILQVGVPIALLVGDNVGLRVSLYCWLTCSPRR